MAQTNYTPISLYYSATASAVPLAANLVNGELAININTADGKLYYKDSAGVVQLLAQKGGGIGTSSNTQILYNSSGSVAGSANLTFNGTTLTANTISATNAIGVASGGTGAATFTANNVLLGNGTSAFQVVAPGTNGNVLTSNGTTWQSTAPAASGVSQAKATMISLIFGAI
jgi:hypothetical protein